MLLAIDGADDPGAGAVLDRYAQARRTDLALRSSVIDLFNRVCKADTGLARGLRRAGLSTVHGLSPLRARIMQAGMGRG